MYAKAGCEGETPAKGHYQFLQLVSRPAVPETWGGYTQSALALTSISSSAPPAHTRDPAGSRVQTITRCWRCPLHLPYTETCVRHQNTSGNDSHTHAPRTTSTHMLMPRTSSRAHARHNGENKDPAKTTYSKIVFFSRPCGSCCQKHAGKQIVS